MGAPVGYGAKVGVGCDKTAGERDSERRAPVHMSINGRALSGHVGAGYMGTPAKTVECTSS